MRAILTAAIVLAMGNGLRADEMDRDIRARGGTTAIAKSPIGGSELDRESPDQSHGWRWRHGWGYGVGWGVSYFPTCSFGSFYASSYGWGHWNGGWGGGYSVSYYRPVYYGGFGWYRGCW